MTVYEILLTAVALSADAMAVALSSGLAAKQVRFAKAFLMAALFGIFQAAMPVIGYYLLPFLSVIFGDGVIHFAETFANIIAFILLAFIGSKMIIDAFRKGKEASGDPFAIGRLFAMALATSIDALAMGIVFRSFAFDTVKLLSAALLTGVTTLLLSFICVMLGRGMNCVFGEKFRKYSAAAGGAVLILLGIKILIEQFIK